MMRGVTVRAFARPFLVAAAALAPTAASAQTTPEAAHTDAGAAGVRLELVADGFTAPVALEEPDDGSGRRFVVDQTGLVHVITPDGTVRDAPFLDLRDRIVPLLEGFDERGLLGFAFHPDYARNGRFYVTYSAPLRAGAPAGWNYTRRVSEFTVSPDDPDRADPASERVLLELDWPSRKHNGGGLAFGPDGHLYIALGDGGGAHGVGPEVLYEAFDVPESLAFWDALAQDTASLYGSILRLDVDHGWPGYAIPPLNPFVGDQRGRGEIYAWGFRNPYRLSFDRAGAGGSGSGDLFASAPAETLWEAVYLIDRPGNYGWAIREGTHCFDRQRPGDPPADCPAVGAHGEPLLEPIVEYPNMSIGREGVSAEGEGVGTAVVGGHVYRGDAIPALYGRLVFGDWSRDFARPSGQVFVASPPAAWGGPWPTERLVELDTRVLSIGRDAAGELYVLTSDELGPFGDSGKVFKLVPEGGGKD